MSYQSTSEARTIGRQLAIARDETKSRIVARYQEFLARQGLALQEELNELDEALSQIERQEADEFEAGFATSCAGKLQQALDCIEPQLRAMRAATGP